MKKDTLPNVYLAASGNPDLNKEVDYPCFVSCKFDGIRAVALDGVLYTRKMLPFKPLVQERFKDLLERTRLIGVVLDGELYNHDLTFQQISSATSNHPEINDLRLYIFDYVVRDEWFGKSVTPYHQRCIAYHRLCKEFDPEAKHIVPVDQYQCNIVGDLLPIHHKLLEEGYEGTMLRSPNGLYKHGRSTAKEKDLRKFKPFDTLDAIIIGYQQKRRLTDEAKETITDKDAFGRSKRGHRIGDREDVEEIGAVICQIPGRTYTDDKGKERDYIFDATWTKGSSVRTDMTWDNKDQFIGRWVEIEYQAAGVKHLPRLPRISRWRPDLD